MAITFTRWTACGAAALVLLLNAFALPSRADDAEAFYRGKTIELYVGFFVGAGYDQRGRLLARYMGRYIPGNPNIIVKNMEGAGSLKLGNWLKSTAPRDGTVFGMIARGAGFDSLFGNQAAAFAGPELNWIGTPSSETNICAVVASSGVNRIEDTFNKRVIVGSVSGGDSGELPAIMNAVFGSKFDIVSGYKVSGDVSLAIERGEVQGRCGWSWSSIKNTHQAWVDDKRLNLLLQFGFKKHPQLPHVPLVLDIAKDEKQQQLLKLIIARQLFGWPFVAPPGVPADKIAVLRKAFMQTMEDREFIADAAKQKIEVDPVPGEELQRLISELYATSPDLVNEAKKLSGGK
jgi:tripartite-type tricarboxylate transporter receptor subunit TctC